MLAIRLPQEIESRLSALAEKTGRTKTYYAREAILEYLDDLEDFYLAEQRYADIQPQQDHQHGRTGQHGDFRGAHHRAGHGH